MMGANIKNLSLVFGISQMPDSLHDLAKGVNLMLHSLHLEGACIATGSLFYSQRHSQDTLQSFSLGGCRSNQTGTWKEVFSELGAHFLFLRDLEISIISKEILRSVVGQCCTALVWFDIITAEEQPVDTEKLFAWERLRCEGPDRAFGVKCSGRGMKRALETLAWSFQYRTGGMPGGSFRH